MPSVSRRPLFLAPLLSLCAAVVYAGPRHDQRHSKIDRSVEQSVRSGATTQNVIITIGDPSLRGEIRKSLEAHGDVITSEHPTINAFSAVVHSEDVAALANHPGVQFVSANAAVTAGSAPGASWPGGFTPNLREILGLSTSSKNGPTGAGVTVALVDSGLSPNDDFRGRVLGFYDLTKTGTPVPALPYDDFGHGTHVAGLIGSSGVLSRGKLMGVAPNVDFVVFKVLDATGSGSTSTVVTALEYIIANHVKLGVQVINLSLGHPIYAAAADDPLVQAVDKASAAGLIVVVSAGNFGLNPKTGKVGYGGTTSPGNAPSAITVGASLTNGSAQRDDDTVASYSSRGPTWYDAFEKPDVVAPGNKLESDASEHSTLAKAIAASPAGRADDRFMELSGTSMATGVATGVVALVLEANRDAQYAGASGLTPNEVKAILQYSATPLSNKRGVKYDTLTQGAGEINGLGAIALASAIDTSARSGQMWLRNLVPSSTVFGRRSAVWSQAIIWGDSIISGDAIFYRTAAWSPDIVWGSRSVLADKTIAMVAPMRADDIVWGSAILWASNIVWGNNLIGVVTGETVTWGGGCGNDNIVWGNVLDTDNIVWGNLYDDNIVWGNALLDLDNIVWGNSLGDVDNIVWGNRPGIF